MYDTIHVVSFRKTSLKSTVGTQKEIIKGSEMHVLYNKYWRKYNVS